MAFIDRGAIFAVAHFLQHKKKKERLKELKETGDWQRSRYVEEGGWATMPGSESPVRGVVDECVRRLMKLKLD